jgi:hypothetical protein
MTAGADVGTARQRGRSRRPVVLAGLLIAVGIAVRIAVVITVGIAVGLVAACTASAPLPESTTATSAAPDGALGSDDALGSDKRAIKATIDTINATAGGSVAGQQAVLAAVVDPALSDAFGHCSPATTTLRFEPVYTGLRATPDWIAADGTPSGTLYALPVLIRTYTGDRITGTDLTTLHLGVHDGAAFITPLCVG